MKECLPFCLCNKPGALFFMVSFQSHAISFLSGGRTSGVPYKIKLMKQFFYTTLLAGLLVLPSCADDAVPAPEEAEGIEAPEAWHDKTRTQPYPKLSNELYINPSPHCATGSEDRRKNPVCPFTGQHFLGSFHPTVGSRGVVHVQSAPRA